MGRKNKPKDDKDAAQQQAKNSNQASGTSRNPKEHSDGQQPQKQKLQQSEGQLSVQQGSCGGQQSQKHKPQQSEVQKEQQSVQQGSYRGQQTQQQKQEGRGQKPQQSTPQGAWRGQQQKQQGGGQKPQQSMPQDAWHGKQLQHEKQQGGGQKPQQSTPQGAWGGQQSQHGGQKPQQSMPQDPWHEKQLQHKKQQGGEQKPQQSTPQGAWGGQQSQHGGQDAGGNQKSQSWCSEQRNVGQQRNDSINRQTGWGQPRDQSGFRQQGANDQQRRPDHSGGSQQQAGGQQHYGKNTQQRSQGGSNQGQVRAHQQQEHMSNENPLPVKEKSCNGILRGTLGAPGTVEVNYLRLNLDKMPNEAYHYDITITPDRPKKFLRPAFEQFRNKIFPNIILTFDGFKNCYSMERLKAPVECTVEVPDSSNRTKEFLVRLQETDDCVVELKSLRNYQKERVFDKPMRALQVLEVVLASNNHARGIRVGRSFFRRPLDAFDLGDGYEAWTGLYQAAVLGEIPLLNVDIAHKSFPSESSLIQYLDNMKVDKNGDLRNNWVFRNIDYFFKGLNIIYTPPQSFNAPPKQYKVIGIGDPASTKKFKTDDGKETTVQNYFLSRGFNLRYPNLNCLTVGSTVRQISLPMELCSIPGGQALNKKDQSSQVEKMIRFAATSTNKRKMKIMDLLTYFDHNDNLIIRSFGLSVGASFLKVPMRSLPSPSLEYLHGRTVGTYKGAWRMDENKFLICSKPPNGHRWAILYEESRGRGGITYHDLEEFKSLVIRTSQGLNMNLQNTAEIEAYRFQKLQVMLKEFAKNKFDLVFVVLNERGGTSYAKIKQIAELEVGILTQCIKDKTVFRTKKDRTVFSNILLKVNGKLNGTNHKIAQDRNSNLLSPINNVMYLGADVTHPSPDQREIPSVVGVAASHDPYGACYNCQYRLQRSTVENIEDMESIALRHLEVYFQYQNRYPDQILYYRDGVSDGQFPIVQREEISAIKRACAKKKCNPKLTCVIVVKRHHTRFFPLTKPQHDRDFNNVQAGTVVDQYITHPNEVQFFMVSHQSIQGTARPTRYNVIMDESKFDINLLQKLTYNLCHLFPRCNRAVSYPAPAYLAHLVAFRGRVYLEGTQRFDKNLKKEYDRRQIKPEFMNRNPMYFI